MLSHSHSQPTPTIPHFTFLIPHFPRMSLRAGLVAATLILLAHWILSDVVSAQIVPIPPILPAPTPLPKELPTPEPPMPSILPPVPVPERRGPMPTVKVYVREIRVLGSTVFTPQELAQVTDPYRNREITDRKSVV